MRERMWSVQVEANNYEDDLFNGTFEECVDYCKKYDYTIGNGCQLAKILVEDGYVIETLKVVTELDEIVRTLESKKNHRNLG